MVELKLKSVKTVGILFIPIRTFRACSDARGLEGIEEDKSSAIQI
jgi:hypothetical protein